MAEFTDAATSPLPEIRLHACARSQISTLPQVEGECLRVLRGSNFLRRGRAMPVDGTRVRCIAAKPVLCPGLNPLPPVVGSLDFGPRSLLALGRGELAPPKIP